MRELLYADGLVLQDGEHELEEYRGLRGSDLRGLRREETGSIAVSNGFES